MSYSQLLKQLEKLITSTATAQSAGGRLHTLAEAYGFLRMAADNAAEDLKILQTMIGNLPDRSEGAEEKERRLRRIMASARILAAEAIETAGIASRAIEELEKWEEEDE